MSATIQDPTLPVCGASSTTSSRRVFATDRTIVAASSGLIVSGSTISTETPWRRELLGGALGHVAHPRPGDHGHVVARADEPGLAERRLGRRDVLGATAAVVS